MNRPSSAPPAGPGGRDRFAAANATFWTSYAPEYLEEHGGVLGGADLLWCPEGWTEDEVGWLGDVEGLDVLEVGCGAAQGSRWVAANGGRPVAVDLSPGMLEAARAQAAATGIEVPLVLADARDLPFPNRSFDLVFTAFGAIPFVPDPDQIFSEVARVLRPGGRWVFTTSHPMRWVFADDPDPDHLRVVRPYLTGEPYLEAAGDRLTYAEFQHTVEDLVAGMHAAGFALTDLREPAWKPDHTHVWGAWSPERAPFVPGTLMMAGRLTS